MKKKMLAVAVCVSMCMMAFASIFAHVYYPVSSTYNLLYVQYQNQPLYRIFR